MPFLTGYFKQKVEEWTEEVKTLSEYAKTQPHAAYAAFTHGLSSKWNYLLRVLDIDALSASDLLQSLESAICSQLIPALTGQNQPGDIIRELTALPVRLGGLGLTNPMSSYGQEREASEKITAPLVERVLLQDMQNMPKQKYDLLEEPIRKGCLEAAGTVPSPHAALHGTCTGERSIFLVVSTAN